MAEEAEPLPQYRKHAVPQRVHLSFYMDVPEADGPDRDEPMESGGRRLYLVEEDTFEGWCPPLPREGDAVALAREGWEQSGTVDDVTCSYGEEGISYEILVFSDDGAGAEEE